MKSETSPLTVSLQVGQKRNYSARHIKEQVGPYVDKSTGLYFCGPTASKENFRARPLSQIINAEALNRAVCPCLIPQLYSPSFQTYQNIRPHIETMSLHEKVCPL